MPCIQDLELPCSNALGSSDVSINTREEAAASECQRTLRPWPQPRLRLVSTSHAHHNPHTQLPEAGSGAQMSMVKPSNLHLPLDVSRHFGLNVSKPKFTCLGLCGNGQPEPLAASTAKKMAGGQRDSPAQYGEDLGLGKMPTARSPQPSPTLSP